MSQPKINPATGYVHDDSQLEEKPKAVVIEQPTEAEPEETQEATEAEPEETQEATEAEPEETQEATE